MESSMNSSDVEDLASSISQDTSLFSTDISLTSFDPEDAPSSLMSAEMYNPMDTTHVRMVVVDDDQSWHIPREDGQHDPLMQETVKRLGMRQDSDPRDWIQEMARRQFLCQLCKILQSKLASNETLDFWKSVEGTSELESRCHLKFYKCFIDKLKTDFPNEPGLKNSRTLNVLRKLLLKSDITGDTDKLPLEALCRLVRFFGPIKLQSDRCVLVQEIHHLIEKSLQYKDKSKKEKVSWFAGDMTRDEADSRLQGQPDYAFLIRMSQTNADDGDFALSIVVDGVINHFEIKGQPQKALQEEPYNACLLFNDKEYRNLPELIEDIRFDAFTRQEDNKTVWCRTICPGLPFNAVMSGYKKAGRQK